MADEVYTPEEVAEHLKVSRRAVLDLLRSGELAGIKVGKAWRISADDLAEFKKRAKGKRKED